MDGWQWPHKTKLSFAFFLSNAKLQVRSPQKKREDKEKKREIIYQQEDNYIFFLHIHSSLYHSIKSRQMKRYFYRKLQGQQRDFVMTTMEFIAIYQMGISTSNTRQKRTLVQSPNQEQQNAILRRTKAITRKRTMLSQQFKETKSEWHGKWQQRSHVNSKRSPTTSKKKKIFPFSPKDSIN